jgi:hypothetical protein
VQGEPVAVAASVSSWTQNAGLSWFATSPAGTLAYYAGGDTGGQFQLAWVDRKGQPVAKVGAPGAFSQIALSPDERNLAIEMADASGQYDLWVMDLGRGVASRVTTAPGSERDAVWSPDGRSLAFVARTDKGSSLRRKGLRPSDPETELAALAAPDEYIPEYWARSGSPLLVLRRNTDKDEQSSVWAVPLDGGTAEVVLKGVRFDEPQLSPDGRCLAYVSWESGQPEVYVDPFRRDGDHVRVSPAGGGQPKMARGWQRALLHHVGGSPAGRPGAGHGGAAEREPPRRPVRDDRLRGRRVRRLRAERRWAAVHGQAADRAADEAPAAHRDELDVAASLIARLAPRARTRDPRAEELSNIHGVEAQAMVSCGLVSVRSSPSRR